MDRGELEKYLHIGAVGDVSKATGTLPDGVEVRLAQKIQSSKHLKSLEDMYEEFKAEAVFLEAATRAAVIGVPWLFGSEISKYFSKITMQWIDGEPFFRGFEGEDLELNDRRICALYAATMANAAARTGFVKHADNKAADLRVVRPELSRLGDLIIIDWGHAGLSTRENTLKFLVGMFESFVPKPSFEADPERLLDVYHGKAFKGIRQKFATYDWSGRDDPGLGRRNQLEAQKILNVAKPGPIKKMLSALNNDSYVGRLGNFVTDLAEYFNWLDRFDEKMTGERKTAREEAYHAMTANLTGSAAQKDGVNIEAAQPWIRNLDMPNPTVRPADFETIVLQASRPAEKPAIPAAKEAVIPPQQPLERRVEEPHRIPLDKSIRAPQTSIYIGPAVGPHPEKGTPESYKLSGQYVTVQEAGKRMGLGAETVEALAIVAMQLRMIFVGGGRGLDSVEKLIYVPSIDHFLRQPEQYKAGRIKFADDAVSLRRQYRF